MRFLKAVWSPTREARGGQPAHLAGQRIGLPDAGQVVCAQQLGQHPGVDLVGLDLGGCDGLGAQGVGDEHLGDVGLEDVCDGPGVGGGLEGQPVFRAELLGGKGFERLSCGGKAVTMCDLSLRIENASLDDALVDVESDELYHGRRLLWTRPRVPTGVSVKRW